MEKTNKSYVTVQSQETLEQLYNEIIECEYLALDTETTSLNPRTGKVVGWSVTTRVGSGYYLPTFVWNFETESLVEQTINSISTLEITQKLLEIIKTKKIIGHNLSFDTQYIKNFFKVDLIPSIWADTTLLVHTVQEEGAFGYGNPFGLKSIAIMNQKELGLDVEEAANQEQLELKESIKKNGGSVTKTNFEIYKADLEVLSKYASADTDLTLRIYNLYLKKLEQEGLTKFFFEEEVMPIYREVTIPMEMRGVRLDISLLEQTRKDIEKDLEENRKEVLTSLEETEEARNWIVETSLTEFPPSPKGNYAQAVCEKYDLKLPMSEKTGKYSLTAKNIDLLEDSPAKDFLLTGDVNVLPGLDGIKISMELWKNKNNGDYINIQSKKHLKEIVFDYMGVKPLTTTDKGSPQFDEETIEHLSDKFTWAKNLRTYNKLLKIKSTYVDRYLDGHEDGVFYHYFKQHGTVSGRYGSNAQQLPKPKEEGEDVPIIVHYTNLVRAFFIAREGYVFIDDDYSSLEPRVFCSITQDEGLMDIFRNGWDFYSTIAIKTERLDNPETITQVLENGRTVSKRVGDIFPDGVSQDPKSPLFLKKLNSSKRNIAKAYSLGVPYGMSFYALSMSLGISKDLAKELIDGYLDGFPNLKKWMNESREFTVKNGYMKNRVGRIRHLPKAKELYEKYGDRLLNSDFRKQLSTQYGTERVLQMYRDYKNNKNNCLNFQIQSMGASIVNRAALAINRKAKELGIDAEVIAQIHDQLIVEVEETRAKEFAKHVEYLMENTTKLPGVDLVATPEIARNWREGH